MFGVAPKVSDSPFFTCPPHTPFAVSLDSASWHSGNCQRAQRWQIAQILLELWQVEPVDVALIRVDACPVRLVIFFVLAAGKQSLSFCMDRCTFPFSFSFFLCIPLFCQINFFSISYPFCWRLAFVFVRKSTWSLSLSLSLCFSMCISFLFLFSPPPNII